MNYNSYLIRRLRFLPTDLLEGKYPPDTTILDFYNKNLQGIKMYLIL